MQEQHTLIFYTVINNPGFPVKFADPANNWSVQVFGGKSNDPGEASQEFRASIGPNRACCYLDNEAFQHKATALAKICQVAAQCTTRR